MNYRTLNALQKVASQLRKVADKGSGYRPPNDPNDISDYRSKHGFLYDNNRNIFVKYVDGKLVPADVGISIGRWTSSKYPDLFQYDPQTDNSYFAGESGPDQFSQPPSWREARQASRSRVADAERSRNIVGHGVPAVRDWKLKDVLSHGTKVVGQALNAGWDRAARRINEGVDTLEQVPNLTLGEIGDFYKDAAKSGAALFRR